MTTHHVARTYSSTEAGRELIRALNDPKDFIATVEGLELIRSLIRLTPETFSEDRAFQTAALIGLGDVVERLMPAAKALDQAHLEYYTGAIAPGDRQYAESATTL